MDETKNSLRTLLAARPAIAPADRGEDDSEPEYRAYANGRVSRHAQHVLVFRLADGSVRAFAYAYFLGAESDDPDLGFTLDFTQHQVKVQGRNLEPLFRLICEFRAAEIREADRAQSFEAEASAPVVERIALQAAKPPR